MFKSNNIPWELICFADLSQKHRDELDYFIYDNDVALSHDSLSIVEVFMTRANSNTTVKEIIISPEFRFNRITPLSEFDMLMITNP